MMKWLVVAACLSVACSCQAFAADPGQDTYMIRVMVCKGDQVSMEIYLPQSIARDPAKLKSALAKQVVGYYTLDLTEPGKGKPLEPVKISMTGDGKTVIVDQYTRGLKPTRIPVSGGTVDFDQRFGTGAKCEAFGL
jgi:hypothetical protein